MIFHVLLSALIACIVSLAVAATVILSLISVYTPNRATSNLCRISFAPMVSQATSAGPMAVRAAHLNNDSYLDLVVAAFNGSMTNVYLGLGDGRFSRHVNLSTGVDAGTNAVVIGDVNGDNRLDIVVANRGGSNIGVFLGIGDGNFTTQMNISTGTNSTPVGLVLHDLNNDTILDLVVTDHENDKMYIYTGIGNGSFIRMVTLFTGNSSGPYLLSVNDLNGDGHPDIAVGDGDGNELGIFLADGKGNFSQQTIYSIEPGSYALVVAHLNRDHFLDIATANYDHNSTTILFGNGDGTFRKGRTLSTVGRSLPYAIATDDFNRDRILDLAFANSGTDNLGVMLGNGNGNFWTPKFYSTGLGSGPRDVIIADVNGDDRLDLISANYNQDAIGIFLSTCS